MTAIAPVGVPSGTHADAAGFVPGWRMNRVADLMVSTAPVLRGWSASWVLMLQAKRYWLPTPKASAHVSTTILPVTHHDVFACVSLTLICFIACFQYIIFWDVSR